MKLFAKVFLVVFLFVLSPAITFAKDNPDVGSRRVVSVTGSADAVLDAHYATVDIRVTHTMKKAAESRDAVLETVKKLYAALESVKIKSADIKKSMVNQGPEYDFIGGKRLLKGYSSSVSIVVTVKDVNLLGNVYSVLADYDSVSIVGTRFKRNDELEQRQELLKKALLAAKEKAGFMAKTLSAELGEVVRIDEVFSEYDAYMPSGYSNRDAVNSYINETGSAPGGTYGSVTLKARVNASFELK